MSAAMIALQTALVTALQADLALVGLVGMAVHDAPPVATRPPYLAIVRHDAVPRDGDLTPGLEHRLALHGWADRPSRRAALEIATRVVAVALTLTVAEGLRITLVRHERTETAVDGETGRARAAVTLVFFTEPDGETD